MTYRSFVVTPQIPRRQLASSRMSWIRSRFMSQSDGTARAPAALTLVAMFGFLFPGRAQAFSTRLAFAASSAYPVGEVAAFVALLKKRRSPLLITVVARRC